MQTVSAFILGLMLGVALPFVWFAVDARRRPKHKRGTWFE